MGLSWSVQDTSSVVFPRFSASCRQVDLCGPGRSLIFRSHIGSMTFAAHVVVLFSRCVAGALFPLRFDGWLHLVMGFCSPGRSLVFGFMLWPSSFPYFSASCRQRCVCGPGRSLTFQPRVGRGTYVDQVVPSFRWCAAGACFPLRFHGLSLPHLL